ncbi:glycoside hydrolase superfamily [Suillus plorans]|uniref:Glycoside hydrolase superfamily n=1 Tax=Suillus plorans TaxID=116603 RepID=A0A9P7AI52_9AGAM|nr:glycoside hydrolase superfamily [Suillus plorans]KAG1788869.1 glycoside hydrolase superfamily [Suillus plorans]
MYTVLMDKFANGDPSNNQFFNSPYKWDWRETQLHFGGDLKGLILKLDYIQGMGVKAIYLSGTIFLNMIWQADSYSPLDFSILDPHWGTIDDWVNFVDILHAHGIRNHVRRVINEHNTSCQLPVFWQDDGTIQPVMGHDGCYESDFDQYGDMDAFGLHPPGSDRLRKWKPSIMDKLTTFSCMTTTALDIDAIRVDKSTQLTINGLTAWASATCACATNLGKKNFYITSEVTGGDTFGSLYLGCGHTLTILPPWIFPLSNGLDGYVFHYSIYRSLIRFLGVDDKLVLTSDLNTNFITAWNQMLVTNDFLNPDTGLADPKHLFRNKQF